MNGEAGEECGERRQKEGERERERQREREGEREGLHVKASAFAVVVNPMVSLISRPAAIRFAPRSSVFPRCRSLGPWAPFHPPSTPSTYSTATFTRPPYPRARTEPMARTEIPAVSEEKQSEGDFSASPPEKRVCTENDLSLFFCRDLLLLPPPPPRRMGLKWNAMPMEFRCARWNSIASAGMRVKGYCGGERCSG